MQVNLPGRTNRGLRAAVGTEDSALITADGAIGDVGGMKGLDLKVGARGVEVVLLVRSVAGFIRQPLERDVHGMKPKLLCLRKKPCGQRCGSVTL